MSIVNPKISKKINRALVLKKIYNNKPISRADLSKLSSLTAASLTKITEEFIKLGLIKEIGKIKTFQGRKPVLLDVNSEGFYIIGIDLGMKSMSAAILNLNIDVKKKIVFEKEILNGENYINKVIDLIENLIRSSGIGIKKVLGIGMSVVGPINTKINEAYGFSVSKPYYNWSKVHLRENIYKKFKIPVYADNSIIASALAESWLGCGKNIDNFAVLSFGEGVSAGFVLNGRLYRGNGDIVAEIGHTTIDVNGPQCDCGNLGCLETFIKNDAIFKRFKEMQLRYSDSKLAKLKIYKTEDIYNYHDKNDPIYRDILNYLIEYLSIAAINLINIIGPKMVIISTNELENIEIDYITNEVKKIVQKRIYPVIRNKVEIIASKLKSDSQLVGAGFLVLDKYFENYSN